MFILGFVASPLFTFVFYSQLFGADVASLTKALMCLAFPLYVRYFASPFHALLVRPVLEVRYPQRLKDGPRHAALKGLRPEKKPGGGFPLRP